MSKPFCIKCNTLLNEANRIPCRNICRACNYTQQKEIGIKKNVGLTERKCNTCNITKITTKFSGPGHKKCIQCIEVDQSSLTDKHCTKCDVLLTPENRSPRTSQCKQCVNQRKREAKLKKQETKKD